MKSNLFLKASVRYYLTHKVQLGVSILGVCLAVASMLAIDLANKNAERAFEISSQGIAGKATHRIVGDANGISPEFFIDLKTEYGVRKIAPIIEGFVRLSMDGENVFGFQLLGIDPFSEAPFRSYSNNIEVEGGDVFERFITGEKLVFLSKDRASELGLVLGDSVRLFSQGKEYHLTLGGTVDLENEPQNEALHNLIITDISVASWIFDSENLSAIDLIADENSLSYLSNILPYGYFIESASEIVETQRKMTEAFRVNLSALSLLGLVVGFFLIYQIVSFSVLQRSPLFSRLRAVGFLRKQILHQVLKEAAILSALGTILGLVLGSFLAEILVYLVTRTISDLYFVTEVRNVSPDFLAYGKAFVVGVAGTLIAAFVPAREASQISVGTALQYSRLPHKIKSNIPKFSILGLISFTVSFLIINFSGKSVGLSYISVGFVLLGFALIAPLMIVILVRIIRFLVNLGKRRMILNMAIKSIEQSLHRTTTAITALSVALAAYVGLGLMVHSFRTTVVYWLETVLQADVYISPPNLTQRSSDGFLPDSLPMWLENLPEVEAVGQIHRNKARISGNLLDVSAISIPEIAKKTYQMKSTKSVDYWNRFEEGAVFISEPLSNRLNASIGDTLFWENRNGSKPLIVEAVFYDYASDLGVLMMHQNTWQSAGYSSPASGITVYAKSGVDIPSLTKSLDSQISQSISANVRTNTVLLNNSVEIFDRTFAITWILQILVAGVAFAGIAGALLTIELERQKEFSMLRAIGVKISELKQLIVFESGFMGIISAILSIPLGLVLAYILVFVINQRSFGWTLQWVLPDYMVLGTVLLAIVASSLAAIYPTRRISSTSISKGVREE